MQPSNIEQIQRIIQAKIPPGTVIPRHSERGHFYEVVPLGRILKSVTRKTGIIKDESLSNFKMNRAIDVIRQYWNLLNEQNLEEILQLAKDAPTKSFVDAGEIGRQVHDERQKYMNQWIETKEKPINILSFHTPVFDVSTPNGKDKELQVIAGLRGVEKFVNEFDYIPAVCELLVYDNMLDTAGTLDDLGTIRLYTNKGDPECNHQMRISKSTGNSQCALCERQSKRRMALIDIKTSNQFKDSYWIQVMMYYYMLYNLTKLKPSHVYIIKVSKEDGFYKPEELHDFDILLRAIKLVVATSDVMEKISELRKKKTVRI